MKALQRYLTLEKFKLLCSDQGIFLAPLSVQSDQREGIYDSSASEKYADMFRGLLSSSDDEKFNEIKREIDNLENSMMEDNKNKTFISSWFIEDNESKKMWDQYSDNNGVVIFTRDGLLISELPKCLRIGDSFLFKDIIYDDEKKSKCNMNQHVLRMNYFYMRKNIE